MCQALNAVMLNLKSEMEDDMYISLKCCDEETGKCASNLLIRQGEEVHDLEESVVGWCPSSVWVPIRHLCVPVPSLQYGIF